MIIFLRPPICVPLILASVIPIPDETIPDSDIVTAAPTLTLVTVVTPKTAPPFGSRVIASADMPYLVVVDLKLPLILFDYL